MPSPIARVAVLPLLPFALLAACSGSRDDPGAITADEDAQLNDAAAMLDANSVDLNAVQTEDGPATQTPANETPANETPANETDAR